MHRLSEMALIFGICFLVSLVAAGSDGPFVRKKSVVACPGHFIDVGHTCPVADDVLYYECCEDDVFKCCPRFQDGAKFGLGALGFIIFTLIGCLCCLCCCIGAICS